jgi:hypothetical protein
MLVRGLGVAILAAAVVIGTGYVALTNGWLIRTEKAAVDFTNLSTADTIVLRIDSREVHSITDVATIAEMARLAQRYRGVWEVPWAGPPVGRVVLLFYGQGRLVDVLEVGRAFIGTRRRGNFFSRPMAEGDLRQLLGPVGLTLEDLQRP